MHCALCASGVRKGNSSPKASSKCCFARPACPLFARWKARTYSKNPVQVPVLQYPHVAGQLSPPANVRSATGFGVLVAPGLDLCVHGAAPELREGPRIQRELPCLATKWLDAQRQFAFEPRWNQPLQILVAGHFEFLVKLAASNFYRSLGEPEQHQSQLGNALLCPTDITNDLAVDSKVDMLRTVDRLNVARKFNVFEESGMAQRAELQRWSRRSLLFPFRALLIGQRVQVLSLKLPVVLIKIFPVSHNLSEALRPT